MEQTTTLIISIISAIGFGGIIGAYFQSLFQRRTQINQQQFDLKQKRYLNIMIFMMARLHPEIHLTVIKDLIPNIRTLDDLDRGLESELLNGFIFASDKALESLSNFIREPNHRNFVKATISMRKDLYGNKTSVDENILDVITSSKVK